MPSLSPSSICFGGKMLPPPKKVWNRFASKVISKLNHFPSPAEAITRTTRRLLARLGTVDPRESHHCRCSCHYVVTGGHQQPEYPLQGHRSFLNNDHQMQVGEDDEGDENGGESVEFVEDLGAMEDHAVDERAEEFIAKFHESLKLERLQHF